MHDVSVIIPTYNRAHCVLDAIQCALDQNYQSYEVIVVNDGSTDNTADVLASLGDKIRVVTKANGGLSSARNAGIAQATGRWIAFLDDDDWWHPDKLAQMISMGDARPDIVAMSSDIVFGEGDDAKRLFSLRSRSDLQQQPTVIERPLNFLFSGGTMPSAVIVRHETLKQCGGFDERRAVKFEDLECFWKIAAQGAWAVHPEPLTMLQRLEDGTTNLSTDWAKKPVSKSLWLIRIFRAVLQTPGLNRDEKQFLSKKLSAEYYAAAEHLFHRTHESWGRRFALASVSASRALKGMARGMLAALLKNNAQGLVGRMRRSGRPAFTRAQ